MSNRDNILIIAKNIKVDREYKNVLNNMIDPMYNIITSPANLIYMGSDFSFIRNKGTIKVNRPIELVNNGNYIYFYNSLENFGYFAWIDNAVYISDNCTEIYYTIDIWTTYIQLGIVNAGYQVGNNAMIELVPTLTLREHVDDDSIGSNLQPENINTGTAYNNVRQIELNLKHTDNDPLTEYATAVFVTSKNADGSNITPNFYGGLYSGLDYTRIWSQEITPFNNFINSYASHPDDIIDILYAPYWLIVNANPDNGYLAQKQINIQRPKSGMYGNQYKNNKIYTYPYTKLQVSNNAGVTIDFAFENFRARTGLTEYATFAIYGIISPTVEIMLMPAYYQGAISGYDQALTMKNFPTCAWASDYFENWKALNLAGINYTTQASERNAGLAQARLSNNYNIDTGRNALGALTNLGGSLGQILTGNVIGGIAGGATSIANTALSQQSLTSNYNFNQKEISYNLADSIFAAQNAVNIATLGANPVHGNISAGAIDASIGNKYSFTFRTLCLNDEYMKVIDDYFTMFGYAINKIKRPAFKTRKNFNYIKVAGDCFVVNKNNQGVKCIPDFALEKLNDMARNGITIWHNHNNIGDYSVDNSIV